MREKIKKRKNLTAAKLSRTITHTSPIKVLPLIGYGDAAI
jgi:hypothetical protein